MSANISFAAGKPIEYTNTIDLVANADVEKAVKIITGKNATIDARLGETRVRLYYVFKAQSDETVASLRERDHALRIELEALGLYEAPEPALTSAKPISAVDALSTELVQTLAEIAVLEREVADLEHQLEAKRSKHDASTMRAATLEDCVARLR